MQLRKRLQAQTDRVKGALGQAVIRERADTSLALFRLLFSLYRIPDSALGGQLGVSVVAAVVTLQIDVCCELGPVFGAAAGGRECFVEGCSGARHRFSPR